MPNGDVFLFDNGTYRAKKEENRVQPGDNFSRGVIYRIDTDKMEIEQVWEYGKERGAEFYSPYICNTEYYADGHYMVHSGGIATYRGEHTDVLGASLLNSYPHVHLRLWSETVELLNDEVKFRMIVEGGNYYRARRLSLYDEQTNLVLGKGQLLGSLGVSSEFMKVNFKDAGEVPAVHELKMELEEDRLAFRAMFREGSEVIVELRGDKDHFYNVPTEVHDVTAACVAFEEENDNDFQFYIHREGLEGGQYDVYLDVDGKRYDTGYTVRM